MHDLHLTARIDHLSASTFPRFDMSTGPSLATILSALNDLKTEIASLTTGLQAADERITRIERVTFTHSNGLTLSSPQTIENHDTESMPLLGATKNSEYGYRVLGIGPSDRCSFEVRSQLKPVNNTLSVVAAQLSRIEHAINLIAPKHNPSHEESPSRPYQCPREGEPTATPQDDKPTNTPRNDSQTNPLKTSKLRYSFAPSAQRSVHPVFGHPSTPSRRIVSLDVAGSPFGSYSDEMSPFSQLAQLHDRTSGMLYTETSTLDCKFRGLSSDSKTDFRVPKPTKKG